MHPLVKHEQQVLALNNLPLNQEAKQWLLVAGEDPDPSYQYLYQLLLWGLRPGSLAEEYRLFLERLAYQLDQEAAYQYLVKGLEFQDPEEFFLYPGDLENQHAPLDAARKLLDVFKMAMTTDENLVPSFPPKDQLS